MSQMPRRCLWITAVAAGWLAASCGDRETDRDRGPGTGDRRFVNRDAAYSLDLPAEWAVKESTEPTLVIIERRGTDAAFAILVKPTTEDVAAEVERLKGVLVNSPAQYEVLEEKQRTIAGRPAAELVTANVIGDKSRITHNFVIVEGTTAYVLGCEMARSEREKIEPEVERIIDSLKLGQAG